MPSLEKRKFTGTCRGVRFAEDGVTELRDGAVTVSVSRPSIQRITLRHGAQRSHWLVELIVGLALALGGLFPLCQFLIWLARGQVLSTSMVWLSGAVVVGAGLMYDSLRQGYFLDVETAEGPLRFSFSGNINVRELENFLKAAEERFGYQIDRGVPTARFPVKTDEKA